MTLRTKRKRKSPTNKYKQLIENVLNTVFMFKTKILYRRGSGVVDVTGRKTEASAGTDPNICHLRSKLQVRACSMQPASNSWLRGVAHKLFFFAMAGTIDGMFDVIIEECYAWPVVGPEALGPAAGKFRSVLTDEAAVAASVTGNIAVLGPSGEEIPIWMTNAEVKAYTTPQGHATTNEAMKYVRGHVGEKNVPGVPTLRALEVTHAHLGGGLSIPYHDQTTEDTQ